MILKKPETNEDDPIVIDLTGPNGNAFVLMGTAKRLARKFGYDEDHILNEMKSSDYENLLRVFDGHFGDKVIMYR
jgi:hypothetical protein